MNNSLKKFVQRLRGSEFIKFNLIFSIGSLGVGVFNYLYRFLTARLLGPAGYGIVAAMLSLAYIVAIPASRIIMVAMKYVSSFQARGDTRQIKGFLYALSVYLFPLSVLALLIYLALSGWIAHFLNIASNLPVILIGLTIILAFIGPLNRGILQGLKRFTGLSVVMLVEAVLKVILAGLLIMLGFGANGAVFAIFLAMLAAYVVSLILLRGYLGRGKLEVHLSELLRYSGAVLLAGLGTMVLMNVDILLVKHFFPDVQAGIYAASSTVGKIILFINIPIAGVMFPMVSELYEQKKQYRHLVRRTFLLVLAVSVGILVAYAIAPRLIIGIMFGAKFISGASYLLGLGVFGALLSFISVFTHYFLSIGKKSFIPFLLGGGLLMTILVFLFHATLTQVVAMIVGSTALLVIVLALLYFIRPKTEDLQ